MLLKSLRLLKESDLHCECSQASHTGVKLMLMTITWAAFLASSDLEPVGYTLWWDRPVTISLMLKNDVSVCLEANLRLLFVLSLTDNCHYLQHWECDRSWTNKVVFTFSLTYPNTLCVSLRSNNFFFFFTHFLTHYTDVRTERWITGIQHTVWD